MVITDKKLVLQEIIENADEKLMGLMIALANEYNDENENYSQEEIEEFIRIKEEMIAHPENTLTPEEAHELIRNKKKMRYQLSVSQIAYKETDEAFEYYEGKSPGLGERFLNSLEDAYSKLSQTPSFYGYIRIDKNIRDIKIKNFPFVIIFQILEDTVLVLRVFNTNRNPQSIKRL